MKWRIPMLAALACLACGCERERRDFKTPPSSVGASPTITQSTLVIGQPQPVQQGEEYERIAYQLSQGKQLFTRFNCNGCHAHGGGDAGPALMDQSWIYGSSLPNVYASIRDGRPNGMPSFRDKATPEQIWQLAAYVRSMSGLVPSDAAPARNDDLWPRPAENRLSKEQPVSGGDVPRSSQMP